MTLDNLKVPAVQLRQDLIQLNNLLLPLAHKPDSAQMHASALRHWFEQYSPANVLTSRGYIVDNELCSEIQDLILYDTQHTPVYEESCWKMVPASGVRAVVKVIGGNLAEPALVKVLREFASLGESIRARSRYPLALAIWAPEAEDWSAEEVLHLIQLIGENNPLAYSTHLALGGSLYFQLEDLGEEKPEHQSINLDELQVEMADLMSAAMLGQALLSHLDIAYCYPFEGILSGREKVSAFVPHGMAIPAKNAAIKGRPLPGKLPGKKTLLSSVQSAVAKVQPEKKKNATEKPIPALAQIQQDADGNTALHQAVLNNKIDSIVDILKKGNAALSIKNKEGNTPLHLACKLGLRKLVEVILADNPDIDARNYVYATPLHLAVEEGHKGCVQLMLEAGAEIEVRNNLAQTPMHLVAIHGRIACSQLLYQAGADINAPMEKGMEPLHLAAWYGEGETVQAILDMGADINVQNEDGNTPLHFAAFNGQVKAIKVLINRGADPGLKNHLGTSYLDGFNEGYQGEISRLLN